MFEEKTFKITFQRVIHYDFNKVDKEVNFFFVISLLIIFAHMCESTLKWSFMNKKKVFSKNWKFNFWNV